jgi:hypothetical protein
MARPWPPWPFQGTAEDARLAAVVVSSTMITVRVQGATALRLLGADPPETWAERPV